MSGIPTQKHGVVLVHGVVAMLYIITEEVP
jgi:hypothetical protein